MSRLQDFAKREPMAVACHCRGPQNGEPACPCQMRFVQIINGRYVRTQDLGPAPGVQYETNMPTFYAGKQTWPPKLEPGK